MQCSQAVVAARVPRARPVAGWRAALRAACVGLSLAGLLLIGLPPAWAERHALLIGVNEVDVLPARLRLRGPANDVALMRQALLDRGFEAQRITVLAQRSPVAAAAPTFADVLAAMDRIARAVRPGDTVVLHLAGHGVQVPQRLPLAPGVAPEPDGLDEVFLLQDSGSWDATRGELPRTLRDDAIGDWFDTLVDRGARVFAVFDNCHAAGLAREPTGHARWRAVSAAELGVPVAQLRTAAPARPPARTDGRVLAYAARGHELAGEEWLPRGAGLARTRVQGVFSFEVAAALATGVGSGADLMAQLRQRYAAARRVSPTPLVAGEGPLFAP
ncbi:MAG: caspase family protein [Burkholderiaceae bacterium]